MSEASVTMQVRVSGMGCTKSQHDLGESLFSSGRPVQGSLAVLSRGEHTVKGHQNGGTVG